MQNTIYYSTDLSNADRKRRALLANFYEALS